MATPLNTIKNWFRTGLKPTQAQFWASWEAFFHKDEKIPQSSIDGLANSFNDKADAEALSGKLDKGTFTGDADAIVALIPEELEYQVNGSPIEPVAGVLNIPVAASSDSLFLGEFTSLANLRLAYPLAESGNYAHIDEGVGFDVRKALWDVSDEDWVLGGVVQYTEVLDEDDMASNSATLPPSQKSVRSFVLNNSGASYTSYYSTILDFPKETIDLVDDEFNTNSLDEKWIINEGQIGKVDLMSETIDGQHSIIDMTSISNNMLVQTGNGKNFEIYQDFTLQDGESIILNMSSVMQLSQTLPGFLEAGLCLGDGASAQSGNYFCLKLTSKNDAWWLVKEITGGVQSGAIGKDAKAEPFCLGMSIYYRISRKGNKYQGFFSVDGSSWFLSNYLTELAAIPNKLFLFCKSSSTQIGSPLPVTNFMWLRKGGNGIAPWGGAPTLPPIILDSKIINNNNNLIIKFSEKIKQSSLILENFMISYIQNGDVITSVSLTNVKDIDGGDVVTDLDVVRVGLSCVGGESSGLGRFFVSINNIEDIYGNSISVIDTPSITLLDENTDSYIYGLSGLLAYWKSGKGDNDTITPYSKSDDAQSKLLTSVGGLQPILNINDSWEFAGNSGFKSTDTDILSAFSSTDRDVQIHYICSFPRLSGIHRGVCLSDNVNNLYYNFFVLSNGNCFYSAGSYSTSSLRFAINLEKEYLFSVRYYKEAGVNRLSIYANDGINDIFALEGIDMTSHPSFSVNGFYWGMREKSSGPEYFYSNVKDVVISEGSNGFETVRDILKNRIN